MEIQVKLRRGWVTQMEPGIDIAATYYLKTPDGAVYGPVDLPTLCLWATDARVIPGCQMSGDQETWFPVESIRELRLNWFVRFSDGATYGPLNLLAIRMLAAEKSIPVGSLLLEKGSERTAILDDSVMPLLVEESQQMLADSGALMKAALTSLRQAHQAALGEAQQRSVALAGVSAKLEKSEADLAASMVTSADFGAKFIEAERALRREQERAGRELAKAAQSARDQDVLRQETDRALGAMRSQMAELEATRAAADRALALEQERTAQVQAETARLTAEAEGASRDLAEARLVIREREEAVRKLELAMAEARQQNEQQIAHIRAKAELLDKALKVANQHADVLAAELKQAKESARKFQEEGKSALTALKGRLDKKLDAALQQNKTLHEVNESLGRQLETVRQESDRNEKESAEKFKQIEKEIKESTELVTRTMREMERRERQLHELQARTAESRPAPRRKPVVVEAEVIQAEVIHAETLGSGDPVRSEPASATPGEQARPADPMAPKGNKSSMLNSVEAQLQMELRKWDALKREQKKASPKWF